MRGRPRLGPTCLVEPQRLGTIALDEVAAVVLLSAVPDGEPAPAGPGLPRIVRAVVDLLRLPAPDRLRRTPAGRPYLTDADGGWWEVDFNISHSGELVGVAVGMGGRIGLDVQQVPGVGWERIGQRWLHPAEWTRIRELPAGTGRHEFTRVWAIREARCKATGIGLAGFRSPSVVTDAPAGALDGVWWRQLPVPGGYAGAVAWSRPAPGDWLTRPVVVSWERWCAS